MSMGICAVHRLAREDDGRERDVAYCSLCGEWMCSDCRGRYDLRAIAALKQWTAFARHAEKGVD